MVPAVILVLTAVVTCVTWRTLTPGAGTGDGCQPHTQPKTSAQSLQHPGAVHMTENPTVLWVCGVPQEVTQSPRCQDATIHHGTLYYRTRACGGCRQDGGALGWESGYAMAGGDKCLWRTHPQHQQHIQGQPSAPSQPAQQPVPHPPVHGSESHTAHPSPFPSLPAAPAQPPGPQSGYCSPPRDLLAPGQFPASQLTPWLTALLSSPHVPTICLSIESMPSTLFSHDLARCSPSCSPHNKPLCGQTCLHGQQSIPSYTSLLSHLLILVHPPLSLPQSSQANSSPSPGSCR